MSFICFTHSGMEVYSAMDRLTLFRLWYIKRCSERQQDCSCLLGGSPAVQQYSAFNTEIMAMGDTDRSHSSNTLSSGSWELTKSPMMVGQFTCLEKHSHHLLIFHLIPWRVLCVFPERLQDRGRSSSLVFEKFKTLSLYDLCKYEKWQLLLSNYFKDILVPESTVECCLHGYKWIRCVEEVYKEILRNENIC